jgi:MYXO-CTERM domain-containing protein
VKYYPFRIAAKKASQRWGEPAYAAYVLGADDALRFVKLGPSAPIDRAALAFRNKIQESSHPDPRAEARALAKLMFDPVEKELGAARELFVSTDGALATVPFGALTGTHGEYLVERYLFSFVSSGRDLLRFAAPSAASSGPFVLANPDYDSTTSAKAPAVVAGAERAMALSDDLFTPLPGTAAEGEAVASALGDAHVVSGKEATIDALSRLHGPRVLHIATHGFFVPLSRGAAAEPTATPQGETQPALLRAVLPQVDDPFVRSGLALAGANSRAARDDGVLSAYEALGLDLNGTRLVTLSACETGLGELVDGIEVQGLSRAFTIAGAETLLTSLWKVNDEATRDLMAGYYARLAQGGGRAESLRDVQRDFIARRDRTSPYYWAAFSVSGNPSALSGARVAADVDSTTAASSRSKVSPGSRGCGCRVVTPDSRPLSSLAGALLLALLVLRRKSRSD